MHKKKEYGQKLLLELDQVRKDRLNFMHDMEIQLVLKQGIVEMPTTGSISDFDKTILVSRKDVETINKIILVITFGTVCMQNYDFEKSSVDVYKS